MALHTVLIRLVDDPAEQSDLVHRFRNFGEDVFRYTRDGDKGTGEVDLDEVDAAIERFSVRRVARAKVRSLSAWLQQEGARQNLRVVSEVS